MLVDPETHAVPPERPAPALPPELVEHLDTGVLPAENGSADDSAADDEEYTILVPTTDLSTAGRLIQIAAALMPVHEGEARGRVLPLGVVEIPEEIGLSAGTVPARIHRQKLGRLRRVNKSPQIELRTLVRVHRQVWQGIVEAAREEGANLILLGWSGTADADSVLGTTIDEAVRNAPCDIAVAKGVSLQAAKRILVPIRGGPHAALAFKLATGLADRVDGIVTALRVERPAGNEREDEGTIASRERDREELEAILATAPRPDRIREVVVEATDVVDAILRQAEMHQVVVMGAAAGPQDPDQIFGPIAEEIARRVDKGLVVVKTRLPGTATHEEWTQVYGRTAAVSGPPDISQIVDKWFAENTYDSAEFENIEELVRLKRQQGVTISLGLPALNEAETIGPIVQCVKHELMEKHALLDEIVLIDSQSTDRTREICQELGIPVYIHQEILPEQGALRGKGEALWKSLHVLKGDIVAWIDTDIRNPHPRFVYGLIGPFLRDQRVQFVKGFYKRPIRGPGGVLQSTGGGRVTELMARPMMNLYYPELSGLIQPLAGEQAGRRAVLEQLPFFTGYGVETGLLIDLLLQYGLRSIGQVDLKRRVHRNQSLASLSVMSFVILQVVMKRLEQRHRLQLLSEVNTTMKLIQHERNRFHVELRQAGDVERPPIALIPEYQAAHPPRPRRGQSAARPGEPSRHREAR
jgi:glucosyl-3-phosphoglycerate synthase